MTAPPIQFRLPAEWEPHAATWVGWPRRSADWPGKLEAIQWVFAEIVRLLAAVEKVRILVASRTHWQKAEGMLRRSGVDPAAVEFWPMPLDRNWTRDFGPIFLRDGRGRRVIGDFRFNAWARYPDWKQDDAVARRVAGKLGLRRLEPRWRGRRVVLEGGAVESNGAGTLITTEECLLDPRFQVRNPGFERGDYEQLFRRYLGSLQTLWLGRGLHGDDTHGHVDDICRFINPTTVVLAVESNPADVNYAALAENRERLSAVRLSGGRRLEIVELPMPEPVVYNGLRLPASYANFYIANGRVLVPTFNCVRDRVALGILAECFPGRQVIGIHARDLVWGLGTIHCLTQPEPA